MQFAKRALQNGELLNHVASTFVNALNVWRPAREASEKSFAFAEGGSWKFYKELAEQLRLAGFPTLSIPIIFPRVLRVSGLERETRYRMVAVPTQNAGEVDADVATRLLDWVMTACDGDDEISRAFVHALIAKMGGWLEVDWNTEDDPLGIPRLRHINPFFIYPDPSLPFYRIRQHRYIIKSFWMSAQDAIAHFPKVEEEIIAVVGDARSQAMLQENVEGAWQAVEGGAEELRQEFVNQRENMFRVIEMQERRKRRQFYVVNKKNGMFKEVESFDMAQAVAARFDGLQAGTRLVDDIWTITTLADYVLLQEVRNEVQNGYFSIIPVCGYNFSGENFAMVQLLEGIQEEVERSRSSMLHQLHTSAVSGWSYEEGSLDPNMIARLEQQGAAPGLLVEYKTGFRPPAKIESTQLSSGEVQRSQLAMLDADNITAIGRGELGQPEGSESGILHAQKTKESNDILRAIMESLKAAKKIAAKYVLDMLQLKMEPGRVISIVGPENSVEQIVVDKRLNIGKYEIKMIAGDASETQRMQKLAEADAIISRMDPSIVPWDLYVDLLAWPDKGKWKQRIQASLGISPQNQAALAEQVGALQNGISEDRLPAQGLEMPPPTQVLPATDAVGGVYQ